MLVLVCLLALAPLAARADDSVSPALYPHAEMNTWGKWGKEDQRGAANYITPERIAAAAKLIRSGRTFSLAIPIDQAGPVFPGRLNPHHTMVITGADYAAGAGGAFGGGSIRFSDDYIYMALQGSTQWDGLSHGWYGGELYNGFPETAIRSAPAAGGATRLGIENVKDGLVGRGVLIDVLRHKGALEPGEVIGLADVKAALEAQKARVLPGDIVIVRTGVVPAFYAISDPVERTRFLNAPQAGLGRDVVPWVRDSQIAGIAADNLGLERIPSPEDPANPAPLHGNLLRDLGVYIGEIWWLEELAEDCARDGRWEFFLAAQPLHVPGAVGSPLNPIAIK
jgi:kynurenine formamidase